MCYRKGRMQSGLKIVFMGVCGSGKTTLAARVAAYLGCGPVIEADTFHSPDMKQKMRAGIPLTDEDRFPWLDRMRHALAKSGDGTVVATCSALRKIYRERLYRGNVCDRVHFIFLDAPREVIAERLALRQHEYMPASLLTSQFETLEAPVPGEPATRISVAGSEDEAFESLVKVLKSL
jgi:carbohydrate kinase (thermoresistant glucokinase family)